jgi:Tetratricopeptide repeat
VRIDGYKRHLLTDLDTELVPAVGVTAANLPEAEVTDQIKADLDAQNLTLGELGIDRAYLSSSLVRDRPDDLQVFCKAFPVRNGHLPDLGRSLNNLGATLADQGRHKEAEQQWRHAADAGDHLAQGNLGVLLKERGQLAEAEDPRMPTRRP